MLSKCLDVVSIRTNLNHKIGAQSNKKAPQQISIFVQPLVRLNRQTCQDYNVKLDQKKIATFAAADVETVTQLKMNSLFQWNIENNNNNIYSH